MATVGFSGRGFTISKWDDTTTALAGVRSRSVSHSNDYVDVTSDDDDGLRKLLADPATRSVEITVSGITSDLDLLEAINPAGNTAITETGTVTATLPVGATTKATVTGEWCISSFEISGEHDGAVEFSATFMSAGEITYTAGS